MTFTELVVEVAEETKLPRRIVTQVVRSFLRNLGKKVLSGVEVRIVGFGVFYPLKQKRKSAFGHRVRRETLMKFKESRHGEVWGRHRRREDQDRKPG